ncbi:hypothetical protein G9A89_004241 [Geosiphon pyriformis]|nr:hypothetical protein G9A89_004241 [Geosiphon pyriformis]
MSNFCQNCKKNEIDLDPEGYNSNHCSDFCRINTFNQSFDDEGKIISPCTQCKRFPHVQAPCIIQIAQSEDAYKSVSEQWNKGWKASGLRPPKIISVWKIFLDINILNRYKRYRDKVEEEGNFQGRKFPKGNGKRSRRFHGTSQICLLGLSTKTLCTNPKCATCGIIRTSYKLSLSDARGFFGEGIYFSSSPSKSHVYNEDSQKTLKILQDHRFSSKFQIYSKLKETTYRTMFLNRVIVGNRFEQCVFQKFNPDTLPEGYHSVVGEPTKSENGLEYDELIVYKEDACVPCYFIVYQV